MHDKTNELFDRIVKQTFGPAAEFGGALATPTQPGNATIILDGQRIGTGRTFDQAYRNARTTAAKLTTNRRPQGTSA